jgi:pimeloyl-ACP methyl ester carboxylesterase
MVKILFIMFQGGATNLKHWNYYTKSKFLDRLKTLGSDSDIDFNLSYIKPNTHIKMIYNDICLKYKNIEEYKFIPIGWSMGSGMALYFCQKYKQQCIHCILLDPLYITPTNMLLQLKNICVDNTNITNNKLQKMLYNLKKYNTE